MTIPYAPPKPPGTVQRYLVRCRYCGTVVVEVDTPGVVVRRNQCPDRGCRMPVEARSG